MSNKIREALAGMLAIVDESRGVEGYHFDGDIAAWDEFPEVEAARAALAQQPAAAVPDGWKWVPVNPTPEMIQAGRDEPLAGEADEDAPEDYRAVYRAMLSAAPAAPVAQEPVAYVSEESFSSNGTSDIITRNLPVGTALYTAPPAAEQPDTVKVPRELLRELADIADSMQCFDARDDAMGLLDKEGE